MIVWAVLSAALLYPGPSQAWRETGHFVVCEIAHRQLSDAARERVDEILEGRPFAPQCTWPDMVRKTAQFRHTFPWHFLNLEGDDYFEPGTLNEEGDVLQALLAAEETLLDPEAGRRDTKLALRFLGHLAGDSHQPLHTGHKSDLGGNTILVRWFGEETFDSVSILMWEGELETCAGDGLFVEESTGECVVRTVERVPVNLHKVWDLLMIERFIEARRLAPEANDSEFLHKAYSTALDRALSPEEIDGLRSSTFWDWVAESLTGRKRAYAVGEGRLGQRYYRRNIEYLNRRLAQAGHRLAFTLERLFGDRSPESAAIEARHDELRRQIRDLAASQESQ